MAAALTDGGDRAEALKELVAKISFLRITAPRLPQDRSITAARFIFRDGKVVEGEAETPGLRVASSQCSMPEFRQKHAELMKRQYFGKEPPPYDPSTF